MFKILLLGLGSAGQRHLRIFKKIFKNKKIQIFCIRETNRNLIIKDNLSTKATSSLSKFYNLKKINYRELEKLNLNLAVISNPISKHITSAIKLAKLKINLLIEKPLSHNNDKINLLNKIVKKNKILVRVGYQLRYNPGIKILKEIIKTNQLGKPISGLFYFGEYLPNMHKYEDYKKTHMSLKKQGGGAINCLSHQIDLINFLLGKPKKIISFFNKVSKLKINVEDNLHAIFFYKNLRKFTLNINFLKSPPRNFIFIEFENGSAEWDYTKKYLVIHNYKTNKVLKKNFFKFKRNDMFEEQNREIINSIIKKRNNNNSFDTSLKTQEIISKLKNEIRK
jgi:predicted dehydrogenase